MGLVTVGSELAKLEYQKGGVWYRVPGVNSYRETGGEPPERDDAAFEGVSKRTGHARVPGIEMPAFYQPLHAAWQDLYQAALKKINYRFRLTTLQEQIFKADPDSRVAIAADGAVTFTVGELPDLTDRVYGPGLSILLKAAAPPDPAADSSLWWHLDTVDNETATAGKGAVVRPVPSAAIAAVEYAGIYLAGAWRGSAGFLAAVRLAGLMELSAEASAQTTLTISPRAPLPVFSPAA